MKILFTDTCTGDCDLCKGISAAIHSTSKSIPSQGVPPSRPLTLGTWDRTGQEKLMTKKGGKQ